MPNGGQRLGERIAGWLENVLGFFGIDRIIEGERARRDEWQAIDSLEALHQYARDNPGVPPHVLAHRAKELGASDIETVTITNPHLSGSAPDPSAWLAEQLQKAFASPSWQELNEVMGAMAVDPFLASLIGGELDPNAPELERVRRFLGTVSSFEVLGSLISTIVETVSAGQIENAGRMFSDLKWSLGICFTSWQSTSPIIEAVVLKPLQKLINETFRPADFTRSQWTDLFALGKIGRTRFREELRRQGYADDKITWLLSLAEKQLSESKVIALWHKGAIGEVECGVRLKQMGYSDRAVGEILFLSRKEETDVEKGAYLGTLRKALKEQLIGEEIFAEALRKQGRSEEAIALEISVIKLDWEVEAKTAAKSDIKAAYMQDVIGRPEAEHWLSGAGFTAHDTKVICDTWDRQKAPTYKTINKSEILQAWGVSVLTQPEAFQKLKDVGYPDQDAVVLMDTYAKTHMATKPPEGKALRDSDIMWAWHVEAIEEGEALAGLVELGWSDEDAALIFETFQRLHPRITAKAPKELKKNDILEAWGKGVVTEEAAFAKLVAIGYEEPDADVLMRTYAARPEALPPEPTIAQLISATRRGVIDQAILSQKLTVLGLPEESVQFYVSYATTPLPERTRSLSRTDILKLWVQGRHDRAWSLERLLALNYSPEDAEDILWLARPSIEDTETYVLWKAELIDADVAAAMWFTMGFSDEQIAEVLGGE